MNKTKPGPKPSKLSYTRASDLKAAEIAQKLNDGKVLVRLDKRTHVMVPTNQRERYEKEFRLKESKRPENADKVEFLQSKQWKIGVDGYWHHLENLMQRDFESALNISGYYARCRTSWQ